MTDTYATLTTEKFKRTDSGKSWKSKPFETKTEKITEEQHENMTNEETQRFFRRLGGSETAVKSYTSKGYKVGRLTSCDPSRELKIVRSFDIK